MGSKPALSLPVRQPRPPGSQAVEPSKALLFPADVLIISGAHLNNKVNRQACLPARLPSTPKITRAIDPPHMILICASFTFDRFSNILLLSILIASVRANTKVDR